LNRSALVLASLFALSVSACTSDRLVGPPESTGQSSGASASLISAHSAFQRYVAIGTSISAGVQSDGLIFTSQASSWPAQLDAAAGRILKQPYIGGTGCASPVVTPLILATRLSGESVLTPAANLSCSPLLPGVTLPVDNVSLNGALTLDALSTTPQNITDAGNAKIYGRVLQTGATQISTMLAANPTIVSVELGSNEVLGALSGVAVENVTVFPFAAWVPLYDQVLAAVQSKTNTAVVVGLIDDLRHVPAFRTGNELWADRVEFALFHVRVSSDCQGSTNVLFVPFTAGVAAAAGLSAAQHGAGFVPFSCAASPNPLAKDFILTSAEANALNAQMQQMSTQIQNEATQRGFAYFALGALYDRSDIKGPFSLTKLMTSFTPFGTYFSADGVHPSGAGQTILARAAAQALNNKYGLGIPLP
jgi:lysophospholipase L1-like esterase